MRSNVIGPFTQRRWNTLRDLRASVRFMKEKDSFGYKGAIEKETKLYRYFLGKVA
jgi:hypothetical protein